MGPRKQVVEAPRADPVTSSQGAHEPRLDERGRPMIERMSARIGDLEHRLDWLERKYDPSIRGDGQARIRGEILALRAAILVMRYHELEVGGEHSVVTALERLVDALRRGRQLTVEAQKAFEHAEHVLAELG